MNLCYNPHQYGAFRCQAYLLTLVAGDPDAARDGDVDTPLLKTKLHVPPVRPERVPRPRLIEPLDASICLDHKLVLVSAPAGFGTPALHRRCK